MFDVKIYSKRREILKKRMKTGLLLFPGNEESPMNYSANGYRFRQDSTFLYYFGLNEPGLAAVMDLDSDQEILFGNDLDMDDIIWMGYLPGMAEKCRKVGVSYHRPLSQLPDFLAAVVKQGRKIHFLPPYRPENKIKLFELLGIVARILHHRAQVFQVKQQQPIIVGDFENDGEHARLGLIQCQQAAEQQGSHF